MRSRSRLPASVLWSSRRAASNPPGSRGSARTPQAGEAGAPEAVGCRFARASKPFPGDHFRETTMSKTLALALVFVALPAAAQTTTTVTTQTQPQPGPSTQVVVNPSDPNDVPPPRTTVRSDENVSGVATVPSGRSAVAIIATDALYGGVAGTLIGGGVTLIDQGNNWARNLMIGAGIGILAGAGYGVYESATQPPPRRSYAERDPGESNVNGFAVTAMSGRF